MAYSNLGYTEKQREKRIITAAISDVGETVDTAVETSVEKIKYYRNVKEFGVVGDGVTDDRAALQAAIDAVSAQGGGVLYSRIDMPIAFRGILRIKANVRVEGINLVFISQTCQVFMQGENCEIHDFVIDSKAYNNSNGGVIEIVDATRYVIADGTIKGSGLFKAIMCKTRQKQGSIYRVEIIGLGWGVLVNDGTSEQNADYRKVDGKDYSDGPIGDGLLIDGVIFTPNPGNFGDGIEINTPDWSIRNVKILNCTINAAYSSGVNNDHRGNGIGAANNIDLIIADCTVSNTDMDAYHVEKGKYHKIQRCHGYLAGRALGISHSMFSKVIDCTFENCGTWLAAYSNALNKSANVPYQKAYDLLFKNCSFAGVKPGIESTSYGFIIGYATTVRIQDCTFFEYGGSPTTAIIQFSNTNFGNVSSAIISGCMFDKGSSTVTPTAVVQFNGADCINNWYKNDNTILGYSAISVQGSTDRNKIELSIRRNVTFSGDTAATSVIRRGYSGDGAGDPTGFMSARDAAEYKNTVTSQRFLSNATTWIAQPNTTA